MSTGTKIVTWDRSLTMESDTTTGFLSVMGNRTSMNWLGVKGNERPTTKCICHCRGVE
jgi:hypothetical protein